MRLHHRISAGLVAVLLGGWPPLAKAEGRPRVLVAGDASDPLVWRFGRELAALRMEAISVGPVANCDVATIDELALTEYATAAVCKDGDVVSTWYTDALYDYFERVPVAPVTEAPHELDLTSTRIAELVRAIIDRDRDRRDNRIAAETALGAAEAVVPIHTEERHRPIQLGSPPSRYVAINAGPSWFAGTRSELGLGANVELGVGKIVAPFVRADYAPSYGGTITGSRGATREDQASLGMVLAGVAIPATGFGSRVSLRGTLGTGAMWLRGQSTLDLPGGGGARAANTAATPVFATGGSLSVRVAGPVRAAADGLIAVSSRLLAIESDGLRYAEQGHLLASMGLRLEVVVP